MIHFLVLSALLAATARAETLPGPYPARIVRVIDGDSVEAVVRIWLDQDVTVIVRVAGIDAAELDAPCISARLNAVMARAALAQRLAAGTATLSAVRRDKYGGRVVADIADADGADIATALGALGVVRPYAGRRPDWCAAAVAGGGREGG